MWANESVIYENVFSTEVTLKLQRHEYSRGDKQFTPFGEVIYSKYDVFCTRGYKNSLEKEKAYYFTPQLLKKALGKGFKLHFRE